MDKKTLLEAISYLQICLSHKLDRDKVNIYYWRHLKDIPDEDFERACSTVIKEFIPTAKTPFPLVAHFLKYCGESTKDKSNYAISTLKMAVWRVGIYNSVDFLDPALNLVVMSSGGWPSICNWSSKEWDINEGRLKESYMSFIKKGSGRPDHLPGLSERSGGFFTLYVPDKKENMVEFKKYDDPEQLINDSEYKDRKFNYYENIGYQYLLK